MAGSPHRGQGCRERSWGPKGLRIFVLLAVGLVSFLLTAAAASAGAAGSEPAVVVGMTNRLEFRPQVVRIETGQTVEWQNTSLLVHTVTGDPHQATLDESVRLPEGAKPFDSGNLDPQETYRHTFQAPGNYRYFCEPHEGAKMFGTVIVQ